MRLILFVLVFSLSHAAISQKSIHQQTIGWRGQNIQLSTITNKELSCSFLLNKDSVKAFLLDKDGSAREIFTVKRKRDENLLGGFIKDQKIHLFMDNALSPGLHSWLFDLSTGKLKETVFPFEITKERIIGRLSSENHFFYFTVSRKKPEFVIYNFTDEQHYDTLRYKVGEELVDRINKKSFLVEHVGMEGECDVNVAASLVKSYLSGDTFRIVSNLNNNVTDIYEFDLNTNNSHSRHIDHPRLEADALIPHSDNSFLYGNKLYYVIAGFEKFRFQVYDFYTGKMLSEQIAAADEEISFKNSPLIQEGGAFGGGTRQLERTKQLLRKMMNGIPVITVTRDTLPSQVQVMIGSYKEGGGNGPYLIIPVFTPGVSMFIMVGTFSRYSWMKSARFKMLMNTDTHNHVPGTISSSINEKITAYTETINIPPEAENLVYFQGSYHYIFYDKELRQINIVQF